MKSQIHTHKKNNFKIVSKNLKNITLALVTTLFLASCSKDEATKDIEFEYKPQKVEAAAFKTLKDKALESITEKFSMNTGDGVKTFTSKNGTKITINPDNIVDQNGNAVTGDLEFEYIEIFKGGAMALTDKPTMGIMPDGKRQIIISGGEIKLGGRAKSSEAELNLKEGTFINVQIPTGLTGAADNEMILWDGGNNPDNNNNFEWAVKENDEGTNAGGVRIGGKGDETIYSVLLNGFGWTNVDRFYSDPREKTMILVGPPPTYDATNSAVYLHYDGLGNALAKLDTFDTATNLFSEHYGMIPVGLACHIIFVTESNGQWRYAIKPVTITANAIYNITLAETTVGTQAQVEAAINALP